MIKAIIYDFDGTIAATEPIYLKNYCDIMADYGILCDEEDKYRIYGSSPYEKAAAIKQRYSLPFDEEEAASRYRKMNIENLPEDYRLLLYDDVIETLSCFQSAGIRQYICSNTDSGRVEQLLEGMGILSYFKDICGKDKSQGRKPASIPYEYMLERYGYKRNEVVAIEDSINGVNSAKGAGIYTIGLCRFMRPEDLNADAHISSLTEIKERLKRLNSKEGENGYVRI